MLGNSLIVPLELTSIKPNKHTHLLHKIAKQVFLKFLKFIQILTTYPHD